jgi:hypothetical protein
MMATLAKRTAVDILLPLDDELPVEQRIRMLRDQLARSRSERPTRQAVRNMLAAWVAETTPTQLVLR